MRVISVQYGSEILEQMRNFIQDFTVDFADPDGTEYIVYNSAVRSASAGIIAWGDMKADSRLNVQSMKRPNDNSGVALVFDPETMTASITPLSAGFSPYIIGLATNASRQLWYGGDIRMWWML